MLVLTRKLMEKLYIGDNICVTVVRLEGGQVRLGIDAPRQVPVIRAELRRDDSTGSQIALPSEPAGADGLPPRITTPSATTRDHHRRRRGPSR